MPASNIPITLRIGGMTCATCAGRVERVLRSQAGVAQADVHLVHERAEVLVAPGTDVQLLCEAVEHAGFEANLQRPQAKVSAAREDEAAFIRASRQEGRMLLASVLLTAPLLLPMLLMPFGVHLHLNPWLQLALATPVQFWLGARFYRTGTASLRAGTGSMDTLVAIGTSAAFAYSCVELPWVPHAIQGPLYYEASAAVITLVRFGKWLESRAKRGTTEALRGLLALQPERATVRRSGVEQLVAIEEIAAGEVVIVHAGERVPVDGVVVRGESDLDESLLTGESAPVTKHPGEPVTGGTLNGNGLLIIQATHVGDDSTLSRIIDMVYRAQSSKAPIQRLVDRVSALFVPVVLATAVVTFAGWWIHTGQVETALVAAVSVLVIACPCALGLATPSAIVAGTGAAARAGILVRDVDALERLASVDWVAFDKTGTLTQGQPRVAAMYPIYGDANELLRLAASVQQGSLHPLAKATCSEAATRSLTLAPVDEFLNLSGRGVLGRVNGRLISIGSPDWMQEQAIDVAGLADQLHQFETKKWTTVVLADDRTARGLIAFTDPLRAGSAHAVRLLRSQGKRVVVLSGDSPNIVSQIAHELGVDSALGRQLPGTKQDHVREWQAEGHHVAMVGDGINDAPALAESDVGIAISGGTDVAQQTARVVLMRPEPVLVVGAIQIAEATLAKIKQNLFWAFIYNCIGLPLAAMGRLSPTFAGLAMALSSVSVVTNSLRLRRWRPSIPGVPSGAKVS